jgi:3-dehydroquinate synthetase
MQHDKKRAEGAHRFVLLERVGSPLRGIDVPGDLLDTAIAGAVGA